MKKMLFTLFLVFGLVASANAFLYNIKILSQSEVAALSDSALIDAYIEARVEEKASSEFVQAAGFSSAKDYEQRKRLLRYIFELKREMGKRESINAEELDSYME